jgi:hypothetical protein
MDIIGHCHPCAKALPTYIRGTKRLDYALITPELAPAITWCGCLPFQSHFRSDHQFLFLDFDTTALFGSPTVAMPLPSSLREFSSKDTTLVVKYMTAKSTSVPATPPITILPNNLTACGLPPASFHAAKQCILVSSSSLVVHPAESSH